MMKITTNLARHPKFKDVALGDIFAPKGSDELYVKAKVNGVILSISIRTGLQKMFFNDHKVQVAKDLTVLF